MIDADALPRLMQIYEFNGKRMETEIVDAKLIDNAPTIDAVPVRHGRWETVNTDKQAWTIQCSACKMIGFTGKFPYCPNCGARMDGDDNETD